MNVFACAHRITTSRQAGRVWRGGLVNYAHLRGDLVRWLRQDRKSDARFTTMVDLYRLPVNFPGWQDAHRRPELMDRVRALETAFSVDIDDGRSSHTCRSMNSRPCCFRNQNDLRICSRLSGWASLALLTQVRHQTGQEWPKPLKIGSGDGRVYTTFAVEL